MLAVSGYVLTIVGFLGWVLVVFWLGNAGARRAKRREQEKLRRMTQGMRERERP